MAHVVFTSLEKLVQLLNTASVGQGACVRVLGPNQLGIGTDPLHPTHTVDLAREIVSPCLNEQAPIDLEQSSIPKAEAPAPQKKASANEGNNGSVSRGKNSLLGRLETT